MKVIFNLHTNSWCDKWLFMQKVPSSINKYDALTFEFFFSAILYGKLLTILLAAFSGNQTIFLARLCDNNVWTVLFAWVVALKK